MKGVIYARYSSDNQREESIEGQLRECKAFAEKNENNYAYTSDILNGVVLGGKKGGKL